ncbi:MAG: GEVED domain-containing protein [Phycisphaerae bacterium]|jgi:hypothetical protein
MTARAVAILLGAALVLTTPAYADWDPDQAAKWVQFPDLSPLGIDVDAVEPLILADDWECTMPGPIIQIHIWGSWLYDRIPFGELPDGVIFTLSIHKDIPADESPTGYSMPGEVLWLRTFQPGEFSARPWATDIEEGWMTPPDMYFFPADWTCWQYNFRIPEADAFFQEGTPDHPLVYWLDVQAQPLDPDARFGWKTSVDHWNDAAVWGQGIEPYPGPWEELRYPPGHEMHPFAIDLAFVVVTEGGEELDWGDAPDPTYPTLAASNGANHAIAPGVFLGAAIDSEPDGQPHPNALGDDIATIDDEDGVTFLTPIVPGGNATVQVVASVPGQLDAWLDFAGDGSWAEAGDQIFMGQPLAAGVNTLTFPVPAFAPPGLVTFARFRFTTLAGAMLPFDGPAPDGEVEDYQVIIEEGPTDYAFEFSVDIGSDKEMSDPFIDGDEAFDPGDVYWWQSAPVLPPGRDGFKDDLFIFQYDPWPDPPDATGGTAVPVGHGTPEMYHEYFDLDGHDQLDIDLFEYQIIPPEPNGEPIPEFLSTCIYSPEHLMISMDDDMAPGWPPADVPVTVPSPAGVSSYGTAVGRDEIIGVDMLPVGGPPPWPLQTIYPIADEMTVHASLAPNPNMGDERQDDDVDSLDIVRSEDQCPYWYFSPDHEANLGLDPGGIYQVTPWGAMQIIDEMHLGIPEETDVDAFEFTFLEMPGAGGRFLAVLFSVDENDPLTPGDESGGWDPRVVYVSFLTGTPPFMFTDPLEDDIDALTIWPESLNEEPQTEACCFGDGTCADLLPIDCMNLGGTPMGVGTTCATLPPFVIADPADVDACEDDTVTFNVVICGAPVLNYQWYHDGAPVGPNSPVLTLDDVGGADAGQYWVDVNNGFGMATSAPAQLTVQRKADANCDGNVDNFDISPFILGLINPPAWQATYTCEYYCALDVNRDGSVDNFDISPFIQCVLNGGCP